jgi:hypothetical protein
MSTLNLSVLGFPAVNNDLTVEVRDPQTLTVVATGRPFLDGSISIPKLDPGPYEIAVLHTNLALPVLTRPIRVLPVGDTTISVLIDPSKFRNTPIADIPDANLGPVRDTAGSIGETVLPLAQKQPGESIRAADWNAMASGIRDLSTALGELTRLVTPVGHDHPELTAKIDEMTANFSQLLDTLSAAMTELQRQIQALRFRRQVDDLISKAALDPATGPGKNLIDIVSQLDLNVTETPTRFSRVARGAGVQLSTTLTQVLDANQGNEQLLNSDAVKNLGQTSDLLRAATSTTYSAELEQQRKTDRTFGTGGLFQAVQGGA